MGLPSKDTNWPKSTSTVIGPRFPTSIDWRPSRRRPRRSTRPPAPRCRCSVRFPPGRRTLVPPPESIATRGTRGRLPCATGLADAGVASAGKARASRSTASRSGRRGLTLAASSASCRRSIPRSSDNPEARGRTSPLHFRRRRDPWAQALTRRSLADEADPGRPAPLRRRAAGCEAGVAAANSRGQRRHARLDLGDSGDVGQPPGVRARYEQFGTTTSPSSRTAA